MLITNNNAAFNLSLDKNPTNLINRLKSRNEMGSLQCSTSGLFTKLKREIPINSDYSTIDNTPMITHNT